MSDLERLIRFAAVGEELSFSRAAKRLRVDQPWLSRQIQQLESQLGYPLFVRSTRKVELTAAGDALLTHARKLAELAANTRQVARDLGRKQASLIKLGVNPSLFWIPNRARLLQEFHSRYSRAEVSIVSNYTPRLLSKLRKRSIDAALSPAPADYADLESLILHRSTPGILFPPEDPLATRQSVHMSEICGRKIAMTSPRLHPAIHKHRYGPFLEAGAVAVIVPEGHVALSYYAGRDRLLLVAFSWPEGDLVSPPGFVYVPLAPPVFTIEYALLRRREAPSPLLDHFWDIAKKLAEQAAADQIVDGPRVKAA